MVQIRMRNIFEFTQLKRVILINDWLSQNPLQPIACIIFLVSIFI